MARSCASHKSRRRAQAAQRRLDRRHRLDRAAGPGRHRARLLRKRRAQASLRSVSRHQPDAQRLDGQRARLRDDPAVHRRRGHPRSAGKNCRHHRQDQRLCDHFPARYRQRQSAQGQENRHQHIWQLGRLRDLSTAQPQRPRSQQGRHFAGHRRQPGRPFRRAAERRRRRHRGQ